MRKVEDTLHAIIWNKDLDEGLRKRRELSANKIFVENFTEVKRLPMSHPLTSMDAILKHDEYINIRGDVEEGILYAIPVLNRPAIKKLRGTVTLKAINNMVYGRFITEKNRQKLLNKLVTETEDAESSDPNRYISNILVNPFDAENIKYKTVENFQKDNAKDKDKYIVVKQGVDYVNSRVLNINDAIEYAHEQLNHERDSLINDIAIYNIISITGTGDTFELERGIVEATYDYQADVFAIDENTEADAWYVFAV